MAHPIHTQKGRLSKCSFLTGSGLHENYAMNWKSIPQNDSMYLMFLKGWVKNNRKKNEGAPSIAQILYVGGGPSRLVSGNEPHMKIFRVGSSIGALQGVSLCICASHALDFPSKDYGPSSFPSDWQFRLSRRQRSSRKTATPRPREDMAGFKIHALAGPLLAHVASN